MQDLRCKTLEGLRWSVVSQGARFFLRFVIFVVMARLLTPEDFGLVGMVSIFTGFASCFAELGFGAALIQNRKVEERHFSSIFWLNLIAGFWLMLLIMAIAPFIAAFFGEPRLIPLTMIISINFFLSAFNMVQKVLLRKELAFRTLAFVEITAMLVAGGIAIYLAYGGYGSYALVWQMLIFTGVTVVMMWGISDWRPHLLVDWGAVKELLGFSANLVGFRVFNYWIRNADNVLIGKLVGSHGLGIYTRAYETMMLPLRQVTEVVGGVMFPALSIIQDDKYRVRGIYIRAIKSIALVTFPMMLGLLVVARSFVLGLLGPQWEAVVPILEILCMVGLVQSINASVGWIYTSQGRTDWQFRWGLVAGILTLLAFGIGIYWGIKGIAIAYLVRVYALTYFSLAIPGKLIGMSFGDVVCAVAGILGCAVAMAMLVWGVGLIPPKDWPPWAYLSVQVPLGAVVYWGLIRLFRLQAYQDVRALIVQQ